MGSVGIRRRAFGSERRNLCKMRPSRLISQQSHDAFRSPDMIVGSPVRVSKIVKVFADREGWSGKGGLYSVIVAKGC